MIRLAPSSFSSLAAFSLAFSLCLAACSGDGVVQSAADGSMPDDDAANGGVDGSTPDGSSAADGSSCTSTTCADQGANCGTVSDGCGNTLTCGTCAAPETCGGGGTQNVCGSSASGTDAGSEDDAGSSHHHDAGSTEDAGSEDAGSSRGHDAGSTDGGSSHHPDAGTSDAGHSAPDAGSTTTSQIKKVFQILMENKADSAVYGSSSAPYINSLMATYAYATDDVTEVDPSEPNYVWLEGGTNAYADNTFSTDADPSASNSTATTDHIVTFLGRAGLTWKAYAEDINSTTGLCPIHTSGNFAPKHVPFVFFQDVSGNPPSATNSFCQSHVVPFTQLAADIANNDFADYVFITPNLCDDMHNCSVSTGDSWLANTASVQSIITYVTNPSNHAILIINWDESSAPNTHPMVLVAPTSTLSGAHAVSVKLSHSSTVKSIQEIFEIDPRHTDPTTGKGYPLLGHAADQGVNDYASSFAAGQFP
jgi:phosphatidylinositol-3-phosphatase